MTHVPDSTVHLKLFFRERPGHVVWRLSWRVGTLLRQRRRLWGAFRMKLVWRRNKWEVYFCKGVEKSVTVSSAVPLSVSWSVWTEWNTVWCCSRKIITHRLGWWSGVTVTTLKCFIPQTSSHSHKNVTSRPSVPPSSQKAPSLCRRKETSFQRRVSSWQTRLCIRLEQFHV